MSARRGVSDPTERKALEAFLAGLGTAAPSRRNWLTEGEGQEKRWYAPGTSGYHDAWVNRQLSKAPNAWRARIARRHAELMTGCGQFEANTWLRKTAESLDSLLMPLSATDADIKDRAQQCALQLLQDCGEMAHGLVDFYRKAVQWCEVRGIVAPAVVHGEEREVRSAIKRMTCPLWWRRQLRKLHGRTVEGHAIRLGYVHARGEKYASDITVWRRLEQKRRNADALKATQVQNQFGDVFDLGELAEKGNSNPRIRRAELMVRIAGFELVARDCGHVADFWTLTAPSRFHAKRIVDRKSGMVRDNPRYDGSLPPDAQAHLSKAWAQLRAYLARHGIRLYGFRVAEPHQDGCPHWHLLVFLPEEHRQAARKAACHYFLMKHDPNEPGAVKNRLKFKAVEMDGAKSAAGYIAKYISKNIDGYQVQKDLYGGDAAEGAVRIDAWAAQWGIRQFQQIGGAPVSVWRELRRLRGECDQTPALSIASAAADEGSAADWRQYIVIQGGPIAKRVEHALALAKTEDGMRWDAVTAGPVPAAPGRYGDVAKGAVWGVTDRSMICSVTTRFFNWERVSGNERMGNGRVVVSDRLGVSSGRGVDRDCDVLGFDFQAGETGPWTRVNNCTGGDRAGGGNDVGFEGTGRNRSARLRPGADFCETVPERIGDFGGAVGGKGGGTASPG